MRKFGWFGMMWVVGTLLVSCTSLQSLSLEQLQSGDISFPESVRKVAVVNNMPVVHIGNVRELKGSDLEGNGKVAAEALAENIANVNYFDEVVICDSVFRGDDDVPRVNVELAPDVVRQLADNLGVDMIFSFDRVLIHLKQRTLVYSDYPMPVDVIHAKVTPVVRVYIPERDKPLFIISKQDSIFWEMDSGITFSKITKEASEFAALVPMEHLLPHWERVTRLYYDGGSVEMRDAGVCLRENDWDGAYELWKTTYEKKKGQMKMKAAFNIALYYEMRDDAAQAKEWLEKARPLVKSGSKDEQLHTWYASALSDREGKLSQLRIQMKRFEDKF